MHTDVPLASGPHAASALRQVVGSAARTALSWFGVGFIPSCVVVLGLSLAGCGGVPAVCSQAAAKAVAYGQSFASQFANPASVSAQAVAQSYYHALVVGDHCPATMP